MSEKLRLPAEESYAAELKALAAGDSGPRPPGWALSPRSVVTYLMGGEANDGTVITPKYVGDKRLIETAIATLATDRALLLLGVPGTAKSWVSEHLAAGITGDSTLVIQCTAGTDETRSAMAGITRSCSRMGRDVRRCPTPLMRAMEGGKLCRFEELTRMGSDVQDTLITVLSEKMMPVPELNTAVYAQRGFNIIATANNRDKGVNELSSALKRRFNVVVLPLPDNAAQEVEIIIKRVGEMAQSLDLPAPKNVADEVARVVAIFRELRSGTTEDGKIALKSPSGGLSTAEAIAVMIGGISQATFFNDGKLTPETLAANMLGAVVKDPVQDTAVLGEYLETVLKKRRGFEGYYASLTDLI